MAGYKSLRLASFNIENFGRLADETERCRQVAELWARAPFDVLMVYEVLSTAAPLLLLSDVLAEETEEEWGVLFQSEYRLDKRHVGMLYRLSLPSVPRKVEWGLTATIRHHPLNQGRSHPYGLHRILVVQVCGLTLIGVHLKSLLDFRHKAGQLTSQNKRTLQIAMITEWLQGNGAERVVLMGDFNSNDHATCTAGPYPDLNACNATTTPLYEYLRHVPSRVPTWHGTTRYRPTNLDHVFLSPDLVGTWDLTVVPTAPSLSDHNLLLLSPVQAQLNRFAALHERTVRSALR